MISVIIPLHNEELLVRELVLRVHNVLSALVTDFEIICVDDGSSDNTQTILITLKGEYKQLKILVLSRNYGHQAAITSGIEYAKGDEVVLIDGDLQDSPEHIAAMYRLLVDGNYDLVVGKREKRNEKLRRKVAIKIFHKLFTKVSGLNNIQDTGHFCILKRNVANALLQIKEKTRYLPGLRSFVGFNSTFYLYERAERPEGKSKMSSRKLFAHATDAIFSFSKWPIKMCLWLGITGIVTLIAAGVYSIVSKYVNWAPLGWSSTILSIYFIGTIQLTFLGVIGEYIYRIYKEVQNRPLYFVKDFIE